MGRRTLWKLIAILRKCSVVTLLAFAIIAFALSHISLRCAEADELTSLVSITTANESSTLDRVTRTITSTADVTITNTSNQAIRFPFDAVIDIQGAPYEEVQMPEALGGYGKGPYGKYYYQWTQVDAATISSEFGMTGCQGDCIADWDKDGDVDGQDLALALQGCELAPGKSITFRVKFVRHASVNFTYSVTCYGYLAAQNNPPVADAGPNRTYTLAPGQTQVEITLDGTGSTDPDGTISSYMWSGTPDPDDIAQPTVTLSEGTYTFTLVVTDNSGAQSSPDQVTIIVQRQGVIEPHPPVISLDPASYSVDEGQSLSFTVSATDEDGDPVVISAAPKIANSNFSSTPGLDATGTFSFSPDFTQQGIYLVTFVARDPLGYKDQKTVQIIVSDVNRAPTIEVESPRELNEGDVLTVFVKAQDEDGDILAISTSQLPANAIFVEATRTLTFMPDYEQSGDYDITFNASDGKATSSATLHITVNDVPTGGQGQGTLTLEVDPVKSPTLLTTQRITGRVNVSGSPQQPTTTALITGLSPSTGKQGETLDVIITASSAGDFSAHFAGGTSHADFGPGITVNSLEVTSPTQARANITIEPDAELGPRSVSVTTETEHAVSIVAFNVVQGTTDISGTLLDPDTNQPVVGASVTIQGTNITTTTAQDGSFTLSNVPVGAHILIIAPPDHELIRIPVNPQANTSINVGTVTTRAIVFDPTAPASVSVISVLGRGVCDVIPGGNLEDLKKAVSDTILLVGGSEAGVIDEYGNQLNPEVQGSGLVSLAPDGVRLIAQKLQRGGETVGLGELLFAFSFGLKWTGGSPMTLAEWMDMLQEQVNAAWADPTNPDNAMAIIMFNRGKNISHDPPVLSPDTRLNPMQAFLFASSLWAYIASQQTTHARNTSPEENRFALIQGSIARFLRSIGDLIISTAYADDGDPPPNRRFTRFWRNAFQGKANIMTNIIQPAYMEMLSFFSAMCIPCPSLAGLQMNIAANWPMVGLAMDSLAAAIKTVSLASTVPEPPPANSMEATVLTGEDGKKQVEISFGISRSHKRGDFSSNAQNRGYTYIYSLYRNVQGNSGQLELISQLIVDGNTLVTVEDPSTGKTYTDSISWIGQYAYKDWGLIRFTMIDPNPLPTIIDSEGNAVQAPYATWFYTITLTKVAGLPDQVSEEALRSTKPWWETLMGGLPSLAPFVARTKQMLVSDYSAPLVVTINSSGQVNVGSIEVDPNTGDVFYSDPYGEGDASGDPAFYRVSNGGTGEAEFFARSGFKKLAGRPGHKGLAMDMYGNIYTVNTASEDQYGGRIFKFSGTDGSREFVGSINYYSRTLSFSHPTSAGPIAIGLSPRPLDFSEDLYVVDELKGVLKDVPVNATWDPFRRVGQPWANIPFSAHGVDLEMDNKGNAVLLVQRVPAAYLIAEVSASRTEVPIDETFAVTVRVENPSAETIENIIPSISVQQGQGKVALVKQPDNAPATLDPGAMAEFTFEYRGIQSGDVTLQGWAEGSEPSGETISSPLEPPFGLTVMVTSPLEVSVTAAPTQVTEGSSINVTMGVTNKSSHDYTDLTLNLAPTSPSYNTDGQAEVSLQTGPEPSPPAALGPGQTVTFNYSYQASSLGRVAFEATASGVNSSTGNRDASYPVTSNPVLVSPLRVSITVQPDSVKLLQEEEVTVTLTVENIGTNPIYNVVPKLEQVGGEGKFNDWTKPNSTPSTLSGGDSGQYTYTLSSPSSSGNVVLEGTVTATTDTGKSIPSDPVTTTIAVGPSIKGTIYDVRLNGSKGIKNYIKGKDLDKAMKIWIDESSPLKTGGTIRAVSVADDSQVVEAPVNPNDGSYTLALPSPGTYEVSMDGNSDSKVGFRSIVKVGSGTVNRDYLVPHSLVLQTLDLIKAYENINLQVGSFENIVGGNLITVGYYDLILVLDQYLERFRKGPDSPPYEGLWQGQSDSREVTHPSVNWDALIRLDASLIFNLRRLSETGSLVVEAVQDIVPFVMMVQALKDQAKASEAQTNSKAQWDLIGKTSNIFIKNAGSVWASSTAPTTDEQKKAQARNSELIKWLATITEVVISKKATTDKLVNGIQEFLKEGTVYMLTALSTEAYIYEFFIKRYTEPVLLDAVRNHFEALDLAGSTESVLKDLEELDNFIIQNLNKDMDKLNTVKQTQGGFNDLNDIMGAMNSLAESLENLRNGVYNPAKVAPFLKEAVGFLHKFSTTLLALQSIDMMRKLFIDKPGQVCVAADQAYSATPDLMLDATTRFLTCTLGR